MTNNNQIRQTTGGLRNQSSNGNDVSQVLKDNIKAEVDIFLRGANSVPEEFKEFYLQLVEAYSLIGFFQVILLNKQGFDNEKAILSNLRHLVAKLLGKIPYMSGYLLGIFKFNIAPEGEKGGLLYFLNDLRDNLYSSVGNGEGFNSNIFSKYLGIFDNYERKLGDLFNMN